MKKKESARLSMSELFKNGDNFKLANIDYGSDRVSRNVEIIQKRRREIQKSADVDLSKLSGLVFKS